SGWPLPFTTLNRTVPTGGPSTGSSEGVSVAAEHPSRQSTIRGIRMFTRAPRKVGADEPCGDRREGGENLVSSWAISRDDRDSTLTLSLCAFQCVAELAAEFEGFFL